MEAIRLLARTPVSRRNLALGRSSPLSRVYLNIDKKAVNSLPAVPLKRW